MCRCLTRKKLYCLLLVKIVANPKWFNCSLNISLSYKFIDRLRKYDMLKQHNIPSQYLSFEAYEYAVSSEIYYLDIFATNDSETWGELFLHPFHTWRTFPFVSMNSIFKEDFCFNLVFISVLSLWTALKLLQCVYC